MGFCQIFSFFLLQAKEKGADQNGQLPEILVPGTGIEPVHPPRGEGF